MAFDVSQITAYVDQSKEPLIGKAILASKTAKMLTLQTGVKNQTALNLLESTTVLQDGSDCGFSAQGTNKLTQRLITGKPVKVNKDFCDKTLLKYWKGYDVKVAAGTATLPFEQELISTEISLIGEAIENSVWQGDTSLTGTTNLKQFDGLIKIFDAASGVVDAVNAGITGVTKSNAMQIVENVYSAIPANVLGKSDVKIFCGLDFFRTYTLALVAANLYHYTSGSAEAVNMELVIPGTAITLVGVPGLNGTNRLFAFSLANVFYGTDLEGDEEKFDMWYSKDDKVFKLDIEFIAGVQVAFPDEVVSFILA